MEFARTALTGREACVLDAGCGTGILGEAVRTVCPALRLLVECDFAHAMLEQNRRKLGSGVVAQVCGDLAAPPVRAGSMDAVLCLNVLPHLEDLDAGLKALLGLLRPGGRIAAGHFMSSARLNELHRTIGGPVGSDTLPGAEEMARRLRALGARVVQAEEQEERYFVLAFAP